MKSGLFFLLILLWAGSPALANNVQISNVSIINGGPGNIQVQFDLSWDNSWRTNVGPANYDGAWVFFKYKQAGGNWTHINMTGNLNVIPAGFDVYQTTSFLKAGAMIYREPGNLGTGTASMTGVRLGVSNTLPYDIDVRGFVIEMVFVPAPTTRPFFGDGDGTTESLYALHYTDNTATTGSVVPMLADANGFDDAELTTDGMYIYSNDTIQLSNPLGSLDPFPTMKAIWCMKYEINQAGYRDFLNTLTYEQQVTRTANAPNSSTGTSALATPGNNRNVIEIATPGVLNTTPAVYGCDANSNNIYNEAGDGEWIACNFLLWTDVAAYLDWSGLAPMSELQYERMCRGSSSAGPNPAILRECAWGTDTALGVAYTLSTPFTAAENASNASAILGNAAYITTSGAGPLRSGIFATGSSNRVTSGASYYGIMEMSGNIVEYCIHLGSIAGRSCRLVPNGNGVLSAAGNAQLSVGGAGFWPGMEGNGSLGLANTCSGTCEVTASGGLRIRGGSYGDNLSTLAIADRSSIFIPTARSFNRGGRGVLYIR